MERKHGNQSFVVKNVKSFYWFKIFSFILLHLLSVCVSVCVSPYSECVECDPSEWHVIDKPERENFHFSLHAFLKRCSALCFCKPQTTTLNLTERNSMR